MLSQNYEIVKQYFFEEQTAFMFSIIKMITVLIIMLHYFFWIGLILSIAIPLGIFLSKLDEKKVNALSEKNNKLNNIIKLLLIDKIKIADEDFFLKAKQLGKNIICNFTFDYLKNKLRFEKNISLINNFLVYGFLNLLIAAVFIISCFAVV